MSAASSRFDVVVFGATGFVGQILSRYLLEEFGPRGRLRWAAAGRSPDKLEALRESLGPTARRLPILIADAADETSLRAVCARTRVVVSTIGPYALHGGPLVKACAASGTDYCDLTGEPQWIRRMLDDHETAARRSGARIVNSCGFDSVPSDLGVYFLQQQAIERFGRPCNRVKMRVKAMSGGVSGGTIASALNAVEESVAHPELRRALADPYSLCPRTRASRIRQPRVRIAEYDPDFDSWCAPFVMGVINVRIVHRTNALLKRAYGATFRYDEAVMTGRGLSGRVAATGLSTGLAAFTAAAAVGPVRSALVRFVLPSPGTGPSEATQARGYYDLRFLGRTDDGRTLRAKVTGQGDPGYGSTSRILGQTAACLALETPRSRLRGGFWTPATAFGDRLIARLVKHAGLTFEIEDD